ncbi:hypothetical protein [Thermospira aquatica]|uniref:HEAT repeat domain-containing protein n=1 Tax=Thermospira aquatica TaxID=2828656 RepID=A0AAX3BE01_9SPIR|nr:hypothetical protein [Thermospira aquatica]URA10557.1 hypothetical protein KDW03_01780 [Thermospira aquatica]
MKRILFLSMVFAGICWGYNTKYDAMMESLDKSQSNLILEALDSPDYDLVCSALKRTGELQLKEALSRVRNLVSVANPGSNLDKSVQVAKMRDVYILGVWVLGIIGDESDARMLSTYLLKDVFDKNRAYVLIGALGNLDYRVSREALHEYSKRVEDERLAMLLVESLEKLNHRDSLLPLIRMRERPIFTDAFKARVDQAIRSIKEKGKD